MYTNMLTTSRDTKMNLLKDGTNAYNQKTPKLGSIG